MIPTAHLFELDIDDIPVKTIKQALKTTAKSGAAKAAIKQAAVWGLSGAAAAKLSQSKGKKTEEEKKAARKDLAIATGSGLAAGAIGALV